MSTQTEMEKLVCNLNLSPYQAAEIYRNRDEYNISRLEVRGGVLFAPRNCGLLTRLIYGPVGDVIGKKRTFMRAARRVRLISGGYHMGRVGGAVYYGDPDGRAILRTVFDNARNGDC